MRDAKMIIILGFNGTGKSTLLRQYIELELRRSKKAKALVVTPDDREFRDFPDTGLISAHHASFQGAKRHIYDEERTLPMLRDHYKNGLLAFDDCRAYFGAATKDDLRTLMIRRRQQQIDIFACGHGFTEVPPRFFTFATEIILFWTKDNIKSRQDVLHNYHEMVEAQERINRIATTQDKHYYEILKQ